MPVANADSRPYWDAARERRLVIRECRDCGQLHFMPRFMCPRCWSEDLAWVDASGRGTVHSFSVVRRAPLAEFAGHVPYVVAMIDLEEGPRMVANVVGSTALDTRIGDAVTVCFEDRGDVTLPQFQRSAA